MKQPIQFSFPLFLSSALAVNSMIAPAIPDQTRRTCTFCTSGQNGRVEKKGKADYARFWLDVPGKANGFISPLRLPISQ
jgi:hypothetical protein